MSHAKVTNTALRTHLKYAETINIMPDILSISSTTRRCRCLIFVIRNDFDARNNVIASLS